MNHEEFIEQAGGDPGRLSAAAAAHVASCADCARVHAQFLSLDRRLRAALEISVPTQGKPVVAESAPAVLELPAQRSAPARSYWPYGIAAAAALAAVLVTTVLVGVPRDALARAVVMHASHEPLAFTTQVAVAPEAVDAIFDKAHVAFLPGNEEVMYAAYCQFRGHTVPHLAVRARHGNVVVLVMPEERVTKRQVFNEAGYHGVIVPAARGSLAIVGDSDEDLDEVVSEVSSRIRYLD